MTGDVLSLSSAKLPALLRSGRSLRPRPAAVTDSRAGGHSGVVTCPYLVARFHAVPALCNYYGHIVTPISYLDSAHSNLVNIYLLIVDMPCPVNCWGHTGHSDEVPTLELPSSQETTLVWKSRCDVWRHVHVPTTGVELWLRCLFRRHCHVFYPPQLSFPRGALLSHRGHSTIPWLDCCPQ